jgi:hypothetical protein
MPALHFAICGIPIVLHAHSPRLIRLFAGYFRYYQPKIEASAENIESESGLKPLVIELKRRRALPPRERLIPPPAELVSQTGVVSLWREPVEDRSGAGERFYFDLGVAAFRVEPQASRATGLVSPPALDHPHILANTYTLFALLLLLRTRGLYHLHAAALVSPDDRLWLICGAPRSGKTTLTAALGIAGWRPVSDDSLLITSAAGSARLVALKKYFHLGDELLERWPELDGIERHHQYLDRTCAGGLEFFGSVDLADTRFGKIDAVVLPEITNEEQSRLDPIPPSAALLRLAEQSMFFQLWRDHTRNQWELIGGLTGEASCYRLLAGTDILNDPHCAARLLQETAS